MRQILGRVKVRPESMLWMRAEAARHLRGR